MSYQSLACCQDNQVIASVKTLMEACAAMLGDAIPVWNDRLIVRTRADKSHRRKRRFWRRTDTASLSERRQNGHLLIVYDREEAGAHARMLQAELSNLTEVHCDVLIGSDDSELWREESLAASCGVILLQTKRARK